MIKILFAGEFDDMGIAEGEVDEGVGVVRSLRLSVHVESDNWAILSEVCQCWVCVSPGFIFRCFKVTERSQVLSYNCVVYSFESWSCHGVCPALKYIFTFVFSK